jgi:two-component system CheB/CheR fusion protein
VLDKLMRKEKEIISHDGNWLLMRILPYRTSENVIGGVVVTFVEITRLKKAEEIGDYFESMVRTIPHPLVVLTADFRVRSANRAFYRTFDSRPEKVEGRLLYELEHGQWDIPELHTLLESILPKHTEFEDYVVEHDFPRIGHRKFILNARQIRHTDGMEELILLALEEAE